MILNYKGEMIDEVNRTGVDLQTTENDLQTTEDDRGMTEDDQTVHLQTNSPTESLHLNVLKLWEL